MRTEERQRLARKALEIRRTLLWAIHEAQSGHAGSSLSLVEILTLLYFKHLKYDAQRPAWPERDYFLLSKGHGSPGLYATLAHAGFLPIEELKSLRKLGSRLPGHPSSRLLPGIEVSTGSLGQGLSVALGIALGLQRSERANRVYCVLGDGELQEGQNWEAMMAASGLGLDNLVAIVDRNGLQNDGPTEEIVPLGDLRAKAEAFGWRVWEVDGHDLDELDAALTAASSGAGSAGTPAFVIANTVKGKGISFMEGVVKWHHHPLDAAQYASALAELGGGPAHG